MAPKFISGDINLIDPDELHSTLQANGINRIDTAARYRDGESEKKIGRSGLAQTFTIDTKVLFQPPGDHTLTADAIEKSLTNSLAVLGVDRVNVLYCHAPDHTTPIAEQAAAFDAQFRRGRFAKLGVSNFSVDILAEWLRIAGEKGYVKPSVFEGQYNLLCRGHEKDMFPFLRKNGIQFAAYSPLAGGFLLGNFTADGVQGGSRFAASALYKGWYDHPTMHEAIVKLRAIANRAGLGMDELSLRWVAHHSILNNDDVIIVGGSKVSQIESSCRKAAKGPLPEDVVRELNDLYEGVKEHGAKMLEF